MEHRRDKEDQKGTNNSENDVKWFIKQIFSYGSFFEMYNVFSFQTNFKISIS